MFKEGNTFGKNFEEAILSSDKVSIHSDIIKIRDNSLQKSIEGAVTDNRYNAGEWVLTISLSIEGYNIYITYKNYTIKLVNIPYNKALVYTLHYKF